MKLKSSYWYRFCKAHFKLHYNVDLDLYCKDINFIGENNKCDEPKCKNTATYEIYPKMIKIVKNSRLK